MHGEPAVWQGPGLQPAVEDGDPFTHPRQPPPPAIRRRRRREAGRDILDGHMQRGVADPQLDPRSNGPAVPDSFDSASCTIR